MVVQKKIGLDRNEYGNIELISATAAWCIGQYAGLRRKGSGLDAAIGLDCTHFFMSISGWGRVVVTEYTKSFL